MITLGLCAALVKRGLSVRPFKKGPDYIDPMWLSRAAHRDCISLDFYTMTVAEITDKFNKHAANADLAIIEGNKGLYDGLDLDGSNSNAALAKVLDTPVVLVLDARGMTRGIAPLILGHQNFDTQINIAGVILNNLGGTRHESKLRAIIEHYTDVKVIGAVHHDDAMVISERHLGLTPDSELSQAVKQIDRIACRVEQQVDVNLLLDTAGHHAAVPQTEPENRSPKTVKIGVAQDAVFGFYYADDLQAMENSGAEIVPFDTINDKNLPEVDALFIGGGFPETHAEKLASNKQLQADIRAFISSERPVYAECGGLMYLTRSLSWHGRSFDMVGALPADVMMQDKPAGRGYVRLCGTRLAPWPLLDESGKPQEFPAHEFHYSQLTSIGEEVEFAYKVRRGHGINGKYDGLLYKNVLASYSHLRHTKSNPWATRFVQYVKQHKTQNATSASLID